MPPEFGAPDLADDLALAHRLADAFLGTYAFVRANPKWAVLLDTETAVFTNGLLHDAVLERVHAVAATPGS
ncbi:MAG: hypothetical protein SGJ13_08535 [Actinomycetota bacterium]|nr:hypothetical protein [Actinomycetota bacterium]